MNIKVKGKLKQNVRSTTDVYAIRELQLNIKYKINDGIIYHKITHNLIYIFTDSVYEFNNKCEKVLSKYTLKQFQEYIKKLIKEDMLKRGILENQTDLYKKLDKINKNLQFEFNIDTKL